MAVNLGNFKRMLMESQAKRRPDSLGADASTTDSIGRRIPDTDQYRLFKPEKLFIKLPKPSVRERQPESDPEPPAEQFIIESTDENNEIVLKQGTNGELIVLKNIPNMRIRNRNTAEVVTVKCEPLDDETVVHDWVNESGAVVPLVHADDASAKAAAAVTDADDDDVAGEGDSVVIPVVQDEYLSSRPFPCDFCSRRFRKKANRVNHMVTHRNEKSHICNICGARYIRKYDLMNHLKVHALIDDNYNDGQYMGDKGMYKSGRVKSEAEAGAGAEAEDEDDDNDDDNDDDDEVNGDDVPATASGPNNDGDGEPKSIVAKTETGSVDKPEQAAGDEVPAQEPAAAVENSENVPLDGDLSNGKSDSKGDPYFCRTCRLRFADTANFIRHCETHENRPITFNCQFCEKSYLDFAVLQEHCRVQHNRTVRKPKLYTDYRAVSSKQHDYVCNYCDSKFANLEMLKNHRMKHVSDMVVESGVETGAEIAIETVAAVAVEVDEPNRCKYVCRACNELFASAAKLDEHEEVCGVSRDAGSERTATPDAEPKRCYLCAARFGDEKSVQLHIARTHKDELRPNICHLCGKVFGDERSVQRHILEHSSERGFSCDICNKNFSERNRLKRHRMTHRDKSVKCATCNCVFPDGRSLSNHRHLHAKSSATTTTTAAGVSGPGTNKLFPCHICHKTFGTRSSQLIHIRLHTGEKPYGCTYCYKAFRDGGTLRKHIRIHTGEKPYKCAVCPRAFNQRVVLRDHIRSHHSAPDPALAHEKQPYKCSVCNELFAIAPELIVHLIQHCDDNTALSRKPPGYTGVHRTTVKRTPKQRAGSNGHAAMAGSDDDDEYASIDDPLPLSSLIRGENGRFETVIEDGTFDINHAFIPGESIDSADLETEVHKSVADNPNTSDALANAIKQTELIIDTKLEQQLFPDDLGCSFTDITPNAACNPTAAATSATTALVTAAVVDDEPRPITRSRRKVQKTAKLIELEEMNHQRRKRRLSSTTIPVSINGSVRPSTSGSDEDDDSGGTTCDPNSGLRKRLRSSVPQTQIKSEPMFYYDQLIGGNRADS